MYEHGALGYVMSYVAVYDCQVARRSAKYANEKCQGAKWHVDALAGLAYSTTSLSKMEVLLKSSQTHKVFSKDKNIIRALQLTVHTLVCAIWLLESPAIVDPQPKRAVVRA